MSDTILVIKFGIWDVAGENSGQKSERIWYRVRIGRIRTPLCKLWRKSSASEKVNDISNRKP